MCSPSFRRWSTASVHTVCWAEPAREAYSTFAAMTLGITPTMFIERLMIRRLGEEQECS